MIQLIRLENSNKEECQEYLIKIFKEKFDNDKYVAEYNLSQVISEFYELCLQEEQIISKINKKLKLSIIIIIVILAVVVEVEVMVVVMVIDIILVIKVVHTRAAQVQKVIILIKVITVQKMFRIKRKK